MENRPPELKPPEKFQIEDIDKIVEKWEDTGTTNFSEMGAKKTTTGLWAIEKILKSNGADPNYKILIVTTRSGKGTFYQFAPQIFPEATILDIGTNSLSVLQDGKLIKIPKLKELPLEFDMPVICVSHYHVFSKSNHGQWETNPITGEPFKTETGALIMKAPTQADRVAKIEWDVMWLDEAHRIKERNTRWTSVLKRVKAKHRHVSTGTGFINRPHEIWSLLNFVDKQRFSSFWSFYDTYCDVDTDATGYSRVVGVKAEKRDEFRGIVREYGPRRTLNEVMPHIKVPHFVDREVELSPTQRKMYDQIRAELYALDQTGVPIYAANVLTLLQRLRAICVATPEVAEDYYDEKLERRVQKIRLVEPSSKLDEVMNILEEMEWDDDARQPVVVFSNFVGPLKLLQARFEKANATAAQLGFEPEFPYLWLKAEDSDELRYNKWANLFPSLEYRVFMSTLQVGGESINLTPSRHVIFLDKSWSPKDMSQGIGRIRRPGQEGQPIVININAKDTTDQYIGEVLEIKEHWFRQIFSNE